MKNIVSIELFKIFKRPAFYVVALLTIISSALSVAFTEGATAFSAMQMNAENVSLFIAILMVIIVTNDRSEGTEKNIIGSGLNRNDVYVGKMVAGFIVSIILYVIALLTHIVVGGVVGGAGAFESIILTSLAISFVEIAIYSVLITFIATIIPSNGFATAMSMVAVFGLPMLSGLMKMSGNQILTTISNFEMSSIASSIVKTGVDGMVVIQILVLLVVVALLAVAGGVISSKREIR